MKHTNKKTFLKVISLVIFILVLTPSFFILKSKLEKLRNTKVYPPVPTQAPNASGGLKTFKFVDSNFEFDYPENVSTCKSKITLSDPWLMNNSVHGIDVYCTKSSVIAQFLSQESDKDLMTWWYSLLPENKSFFGKYGTKENTNFAQKKAIKISYQKIGQEKDNDHYNQAEILFANDGINYLIVLPYSLCSESSCWEGKLGDQIASSFKFIELPVSPTESAGAFCGGIMGKPCPGGFTCKLDGNYPDAGGTCVKK